MTVFIIALQLAFLYACIKLWKHGREFRPDPEAPRVYAIDWQLTGGAAWSGLELERMRQESMQRMLNGVLDRPGRDSDDGTGISRLERRAKKAAARAAVERADAERERIRRERAEAQRIADENERAFQEARRVETASVEPVLPEVVAPSPPPEVTVTQAMELVPVYFKPGEPTTFEEYGMQPQVTQYLKASIDGLQSTEASIGNLLFSGPAGLGKTTLAKIITNELRKRNVAAGLAEPDFIEVFPVDIEDADKLDAIMRRAVARPGSVIFIDEVHDLTDRHAYKLYLTLQEQRYKFIDSPNPVPLPPLTFLAATTDVGKMHAALRRRFEIMHLLPVGRDEIEKAVRMRPFRIDPDAVELLVSRTHYCGAPWESIQVFEQAKKFSKAEGRERIIFDDVARVFALNGVDELGLSSIDRKVIEVLFTQPKHRKNRGGELEFMAYGCSEDNLCLMAQLDRAQWREVVMPKLMARGLISTKAGVGRVLTPFAIERYAYLKD